MKDNLITKNEKCSLPPIFMLFLFVYRLATITYWLCNVNRQKIICKTLAKLKQRGLALECPKLIQGMISKYSLSQRHQCKCIYIDIPGVLISKYSL